MYPPLYAVCAADTSVQDLLADSVGLRLFPFGEARPGASMPYAVWQTLHGQPENYLGQRPDSDSYIAQVDVYGSGWSSARACALALRNAVEGDAYVTYGPESRDPETKAYVVTFFVDWITNR